MTPGVGQTIKEIRKGRENVKKSCKNKNKGELKGNATRCIIKVRTVHVEYSIWNEKTPSI
jgi:hypothetical protein